MGILIPTVVATLASLAVVQLVPQNVSDVSCTITRYNSEDIKNAQRECDLLVINGIEVPAGETLDLSHMKQGASLVFRGTITWAYKEHYEPLMRIIGTDLHITGLAGHVLDGRGALWWDGRGQNGGKKKPLLISATLQNSRVTDLNIRNAPLGAIYIHLSENVVFQDIIIDNSLGEISGGASTDGFDILHSNNITIRDSTVYNQDSCLKVYSGHNIEFFNNYCSGGNGIAIMGGRFNDDVRGVKVSSCTVIDSNYGIRILTEYGGRGSVSDLTYQNIVLSRIHRYGIAIEGDYENGWATGVPTGGVPINNLTVNDVHGFIDSEGANIYVLVENATNWYFSNVELTGGQHAKKCQGIPPGAGISC